MNKAVIIGNLSKDVELMKTTSNVSVAKFSVAVKRTVGEEVDFLNVVVWRGLAESCVKYLKKGSKVAVIGSIQTRSYENKNGQKQYITEIVAEQVEFLSKSEPKKEEMTEVDETQETLPF